MASGIYIQENKSSSIRIENGIIARIGRQLEETLNLSLELTCVVITDQTVGRLYAPTVIRSLRESGIEAVTYAVPPGEASKSLAEVMKVYEFLATTDLGREDVVLALGGGMVSDLAGFVAGTWMRGVQFVICPTTMEADLDAAIGGKTGVNTPFGKNLVGVFHSPALVAIDPDCLATLPRRDVRAGLAESVKHAVLFSPEFLVWHEAHIDDVLRLESKTLGELIERNVQIKCGVVSRDPQERSDRRILLNFGHTIGHAIESCSGYSLRHGECVGLGMIAACRLSQRLLKLNPAITNRLTALLSRIALPTRLEPAIATDRIVETIRNDKKRRGGKTRFVLLEDVGQPVIRDDVSHELVRDAFESLLCD